MIRHIVLVKWKKDATDLEKTKMIEGTRRLGTLIPQVRAMTSGEGLGMIPGSADFGMIADFETPQDWADYREHPEHVRFVENTFAAVGEIYRLQIDLTGAQIK